jgi:hypothetical protein
MTRLTTVAASAVYLWLMVDIIIVPRVLAIHNTLASIHA